MTSRPSGSARERADQDDSGEPTWAVVVIHGVGPSRPGETVEEFYKNLQDEGDLTQEGWDSVRMLPEQGPIDWEQTPRRARFPMFVRWANCGGPTGPRKAVFAETYWADLSRTRMTTVDMIVRLFTLIFHMRYVMDCAGAYPKNLWYRLQRQLVAAGSFLLCVLLAAVYLFAFWLTLSSRVAGLFIADEQQRLVMCGLGAVVAGVGASWYCRAHRNSWGGTWSLLAVTFAAYSVLPILFGLSGTVEAACRESASYWWPERFATYASDEHISNFSTVSLCLGSMVLSLVIACSIAAAVSYLALQCIALASGKRARISAATAATGSFLLQFAVWSVLVPLLGYIYLDTFRQDYQALFARHFLLILMPCIATFFIFVYRYFQRERVDEKLPRLLVHPSAVVLIWIAVVLGGAFYLEERRIEIWPRGFGGDAKLFDWLPLLGTWLRRFVIFLQSDRVVDGTFWLALAIVAIPILHIGLSRFRRYREFDIGIGTLLHVPTDIVNHFYRVPFDPRGDIDYRDCKIQSRIINRTTQVLRWIKEHGGTISRLSIVSHSQGTVSAILTLSVIADETLTRATALIGRDELERHAHLRAWLGGIRQEVALVTMGSPFKHLYQHYFPDRYPSLFLADGAWNDRWSDWRTLVGDWANIYRVDDYVGTKIEPTAEDRFPRNLRLPQRGLHTNYWGKHDVAEMLRRYVPGN